MTLGEALGIVRLMVSGGIPREEAINNSAIPMNFRDAIRERLAREDTIILEPVRLVSSSTGRDEWLRQHDRSHWYYWPTLRQYLLGVKNWPAASVRSLDEATDRILGQLADPSSTDEFDIRGLVLGYVQSGKTANFTSLIAKAADVGYRLVIVLSGIDNGLRRQTQIRLNHELVGYRDNRANAVRFPPLGQIWHQFTSEEINGDFRVGHANQAALQGSQPVLLVVKKNAPVLRRLLQWLAGASEEVARTIPLLVIDDEADQASVDTRGTYQTEDEPVPEDYVGPSVINGLIRDLLRRFHRKAYVAYTATPFANILIPHDTFDLRVANDLYPKDFIVDLPKPNGYFGAEELFGRLNQATGEEQLGTDVVRNVSEDDLYQLDIGEFPESLELAVLDFVLGGAARAARGDAAVPCTMLIHASRLIEEQGRLADRVTQRFGELRDEWRYQRTHGLLQRLRHRWETEFRPTTHTAHPEREMTFQQVEPHIGPFFEAVQVRVVNSATGDVLDYDREPGLKAIAVGGNRLSRGLTLEGLLVSYFVRPSDTYDTLMQMGRWFGFKHYYDDLTRIYTTTQLAEWFRDLAFVEYRLREDIRVYEEQGLTPYQVGMRIWQHPTMQVTSRLKRRFGSDLTISQSYSLTLEQTFKFPLRRPEILAVQADTNLRSVIDFLSALNEPAWGNKGPTWTSVPSRTVVSFLRSFSVDVEAGSISVSLICAYVERQNESGELISWTVDVRGRESEDRRLGEVEWGLTGGRIWQIARTRIKDSDSLGVITSPGDEAIGLSQDALVKMRELMERDVSENRAARQARPSEQGLLLLYPISRYSGADLGDSGYRRSLYEDPSSPQARDLIGLAISFPESQSPQPVEAYLDGTVGWRPIE